MSLRYRTRGNSSPGRKPKVFFCCHPSDFNLYFESICKDIFEFQNCAIYYYDGEKVSDEDRSIELTEMQLFVMPVTTRLLTCDNIAMRDFAFAIEKHIPVLPLMQESGLEKPFNDKCGDLQFLDKYKRDDTAISYKEKLKKYLDSVLIGDELAEKVREAFDAYIFLSYRKKDRKYAQELMRLIHRNEFCRDVAIWYDEFLTPGENFNDAIKTALEKCSLFTLAVTPNLVNEVNYVMTTEYPAALEAGKSILPVEMVDTDKSKLKEYFPKVPECVTGRDKYSLSSRLLDALRTIAKEENDCTPQHCFFVGLAYLAGIDVEVDYGRAVKLITSSAEANLTEAIEKLVSMYRTGEGVARDYNKAIEWQNKLCDLYLKAFNADKTIENRINLVDALDGLAELQSYVSRASFEVRTICSQIVKYTYDIEELKMQFASALTKLGDTDLEGEFGDYDQTVPEDRLNAKKDFYIMALKAYGTTSVDGASVNIKSAYIYFKLTNITCCLTDGDDTSEYVKKALALAEEAYKETGGTEAHSIIARCYCRLADFNEGIDGKLKYLMDALEILEMIAEESGDINDRNYVAETRKQIADCLMEYLIDNDNADISEGQVECLCKRLLAAGDDKYLEAINDYKRAYKIFEEIALKTGTANSYDNLGNIYELILTYAVDERDYYRKSYRNALRAYVKQTCVDMGLDFDETMIDGVEANLVSQAEVRSQLLRGFIPDTEISQTDLKIDYKEAEKRKASLKNFTVARFEKWYNAREEEVWIFTKVAEFYKTEETYEVLLYAYKTYIGLLFISGKYKEVLTCIERAEALINSISNKKLVAKLYGVLAGSCVLPLGDDNYKDEEFLPVILKPNEERTECCIECYKRAVRLRKEIIKIEDTDEARRNLDELITKIAKILPDSKKVEKIGLYNRSELVCACERFGDYKKEEESYQWAKEYYEQAVEVMAALAEETDTTEALNLLARLYKKAARISKLCALDAKDDKEYYKQAISASKNYYMQAMAVRRTIYERTQDDGDYCNYAEACYNYGKATKSREKSEEALLIIVDLEAKYPQDEKYKKIKSQISEYIKKHFNN